MINITINSDGSTSQDVISLGSQFENIDEVIQFTFPSDLERLHKYVVAKTYDEKKKKNITRVTPLVDNKFVIGSAITKVAGQWIIYTLCKAYSSNNDVERVSISDPIVATVTENDFDISEIEATEIDPNIKIIYDELISFKKELESNEATRQSNEATRKSNESVRVGNETSRVSAETARSKAEATRAENETSRLNAEATRASAEVARANAESTRVSNEVTRQEAEESRVEAENTRSSNEQARVNAESERTQYETLRRQSEQIRLSNEEKRSNAEKSRIQSEQERVNAEDERLSAETARATAETNRANAERSRSEAEANRVNAERSRSEAETNRVNAEQSRVSAENLRVEAENKRDSVITKLREDLDANTKADVRTNRSLTALWDLNKGISYRFENDIRKAYMKTIPSGAKLGALKKIGGRTIVYNQLFKTDNIDNGSITTTYADNIVTINGTTSINYVNFSELDEKLNVVGKFYVKMIIIKNDDGLSFGYGWLNRSMHTDFIMSGSASTIYSQHSSDLGEGLSTGISWDENTGSVTFNDVKIQITIVNLTKMFGEGNEPSTVEEFESMFPNSYYPYNEGELISMSVNEVEEVGKNIFKCKNFSCYAFDGTDKPELSNSYGTSINSVEPSNSVTVTQSKIAQEDNVETYENGYFCAYFKPLTMNGKYVFSFDITPSNKLISSPKFMVFFNGNINYGYAVADVQGLQIGTKSKIFFTLNVNNKKVKYIEIRNSGISGIFENFQIEEGSTNTDFSPYHENTYAIPQAILDLDGYGWSSGTAYNYVDFENKKFYKNVERADLSTLNFVYTVYGDDHNLYGFRCNLPNGIKADENAYIKKNNLLCSKYQDTPWNDAYGGIDKTISQLSQSIHINDSSFDNADNFKNSLQGVYLYYELAEPIVTDISDIIGDTFQEPFNVESGGSLTFKNKNGDGYQVAVPSDVQYVVSLRSVA